MAKMKLVDYDNVNDILYLRKHGKIKGSIEIEGFEDIVIDFSFDNNPIGLEIMNASKNLNLSKKFLSSIESAGFGIEKKRDKVFILILLKVSAKVQERITIPVSMKR